MGGQFRWVVLCALTLSASRVMAQPAPLKIPTSGKAKFSLRNKSNGHNKVTIEGTSERPAKYKYKLIDPATGKVVGEEEAEGKTITLEDKDDVDVEVSVGEAHSLPSATWEGQEAPTSFFVFHWPAELGGGESKTTITGKHKGSFPGMPSPADPKAVLESRVLATLMDGRVGYQSKELRG